jgi:hypothetical protein
MSRLYSSFTQIARRTRPLLLLALACGILASVLTFNTAKARPNTTRAYPPSSWILGPWVGWIGSEHAINKILDGYAQYAIPATVFHFDWYTWQTCPGSAAFKFSDALLQRLQSQQMRAVFWYVPLIDLSCPDYGFAQSNHYFVEDANGNPIVTQNFTGHGSWIDFNNPAAVQWLHAKWDALLARTTVNGVQVTGGFYIDNVRPDLSGDNGTAYAEAYARDVLEYTRAHIPDGDVVMKHFGSNNPGIPFLTQYAHTAYVGDEPTNFAGMSAGIQNVFQLTNVLPGPFNEFTGNAYSKPDSETYIRRLHWGALQVVMDNSPAQKDFPWQSDYSPQVLQAYQFYSTLHWELLPYLYSYDEAAYENNTPILMSPNTSQQSVLLGNQIFAKFVTAYVSNVSFTLPRGTWINFWNENQMYQGPVQINQSVPLGREPIWIKLGAIIPMQVRDKTTGDGSNASVGALTVRVYPYQNSSFQYFDARNGWVTFQASKGKKGLVLCTTGAAPSQPLIYKIALWSVKPRGVSIQNGAVGVNQSWGSALPKLQSAKAVQASSGGWYYDSTPQQLWVKVMQPGTDCPTN